MYSHPNSDICNGQTSSFSYLILNILPCWNAARVRSSQGIKTQAIRDIARRHSGIVNGGKHLPGSSLGRVIGASHEAVSTETGGGKSSGRRALEPVKGSLLGSTGHGDGVRASVGYGAAGFDEEGLAAGDFDILIYLLEKIRQNSSSKGGTHQVGRIRKDGLVARRARVDHVGRAVG